MKPTSLFSLAGLLLLAALSAREGMALLPGGLFRAPWRAAAEPPVRVRPYWLDLHAVTVREYLDFVRAHPSWRKSRVARIYASPSYLADWADDLDPGPAVHLDAPVVHVSYFAARAYLQRQGKRLPSLAEWEQAAASGLSPTEKEKIWAWVRQPMGGPVPPIGSGTDHGGGLRDLHGLVWEWVEDFSAVPGSEASRGEKEREAVCGMASVEARDRQDYAAFVRMALRGSLMASDCLVTLGFRGAADASTP